MKSSRFIMLYLCCFIGCFSSYSQESKTVFTFDGDRLTAGLVQVMGAGFGEQPLADVTYGPIPEDNAFPGATNGLGAIVRADPGETALFMMPAVASQGITMLRCSVRTNASHASIYIASVDQGANVFVTTVTPSNGGYFLNEYKRLTVLCVPGSPNLLPLLQITNTSETDPLTVYLDNFETIVLDPERFYSPAFFDGDETDPDVVSISREDVNSPAATPTNEPIATNTPIPTPTHTSTPTPTITNTPLPTSTPAEITQPTQPQGESEITVSLNLPDGAQEFEFVRIPAGSFMMGSPETEKDRSDNETLHQVTFTKNVYMAKFEVTQGQWETVMGSIPKIQYGSDPNLPVQFVTFAQIQSFVEALNQMNRGVFRLPTDAEWEYACRAGTSTRFYWGDDLNETEIDRYAWYWNNAQPQQPNPVGSKQPNAWGLYDMSGNVWEYCSDWYEPSAADAQIDPQGPSQSDFRIIRGGSFANDPLDCRSALRQQINLSNPDFSAGHMGFRLVMEAGGTPTDPTPIQTPVPTPTPKPPIEWMDNSLFVENFSNTDDLNDWSVFNGSVEQSDDYAVILGGDFIGEINHSFAYSEGGYDVEWQILFPSTSVADSWGGFSLYTDSPVDCSLYGVGLVNELFVTFNRDGQVNFNLYGIDVTSGEETYWRVAQTQAPEWNPVLETNRFLLEVHPGQWILYVNEIPIQTIQTDNYLSLESISLIAGKNSTVYFDGARISKRIDNLGKTYASDGASVQFPFSEEEPDLQVRFNVHSEPLGLNDPENQPVSNQYLLEINRGTVRENITLAIPVRAESLPVDFDPALLSLQEYDPSTNAWINVEYLNFFDAASNVFYIGLPVDGDNQAEGAAKVASKRASVEPYQTSNAAKVYRVSYNLFLNEFTLKFEGSNFTIYYNSSKVKKDAAWTSVGSGDYTLTEIPDFIEDMDKAFNLALNNLMKVKDSNGQNLFNDPTEGGTKRVIIYVKNLENAEGNTTPGGSVRMSQDRGINSWLDLKTTAAHELVHHLQGQFYGLNGYFLLFSTAGNTWFIEATAQYYGAMASELSEEQKGAFYADSPDDYISVRLTSSSTLSYYAAGHFLEWIESKYYPGQPIVADALKNRNVHADIKNLYNAMLLAAPDDIGKTFSCFDAYCHYLLTQPDDMNGFGKEMKGALDRYASNNNLFSGVSILSNSNTFLSYRRKFKQLSGGYSYINFSNTDSALLVVKAEQPAVDGAYVIQSYFYAPRGAANADYPAMVPAINFSSLVRENVGKNQTIKSVEFMLDNPQLGQSSTMDMTFYLLRPPVVESVDTNQVTWSTTEIGNIPVEYVQGYKIYKNGYPLNAALIPYAPDRQSYTSDSIQAGDPITVTIIDRDGNEWPKPPAPVEPTATPTAIDTPTPTYTPIPQETPTPNTTVGENQVGQQGIVADSQVYSDTMVLIPIADVTVTFTPLYSDKEPIIVRSNANGEYFVVLDIGELYKVTLHKAGYETQDFNNTLRYPPETFDIFPPGYIFKDINYYFDVGKIEATPTPKPGYVTITGTVYDYWGNVPREGITVSYYPYNDRNNPVVDITDASGNYSVSLAVGQKHDLIVEKEGYRTWIAYGLSFDSSFTNYDVNYELIPKQ